MVRRCSASRPSIGRTASYCIVRYVPQVYCLPDNYEVLDKSLDDIRHVRDPLFKRDEVVALDK